MKRILVPLVYEVLKHTCGAKYSLHPTTLLKERNKIYSPLILKQIQQLFDLIVRKFE